MRRGKKEVSKDKELELLRRQRMARLMNRLQTRKTEEGRKAEDPKKILKRIVTDDRRETKGIQNLVES